MIFGFQKYIKSFNSVCKFLGSFAITPLQQGLREKFSTQWCLAQQDEDFGCTNCGIHNFYSDQGE